MGQVPSWGSGGEQLPRLAADATGFDCAHALCASCSETYAKVEAERSMSRRSGVSIACPLCRKKARVALPAGMY